MNSFKIKIARKVISTPGYGSRRMDKFHREIVYWIGCEASSPIITHHKFCRKMQEMYAKRYNFYMNQKHL